MYAQTTQTSAVTTFPFFDTIPKLPRSSGVETDTLDGIGSVISLRPGKELYAHGDSAKCWYRVTSGVMRTCKLLPDGRRQIDDFLFPGDFLGLEASPVHSVSAEAVDSVVAIGYSRSRLDAMAADDAGLGARLLQMTLRRLGKANERLLLLGRKTAEEKLASFLLEMLERTRGDIIDLPMSRTDIADYLGLTIETVSRTLSSFRRDDLVELPSAHRVIVLDRTTLGDLTGDE